MANDVAANPFLLDTAAVISATEVFTIKKITFLGAAAGDSAILESGAGREIARLKTPVIGATDELSFIPGALSVVGLELASISAGGLVHVYLG